MRLQGPSAQTQFVDAKYDYSIKARYINDCRTSFGYNVRFDKRETDALVKANRTIFPGEELYVDYGKWYWILIPKDQVSSISLASLIEHHLACKNEFERLKAQA